MSQSLLARRHWKITQMISRVCLFDINSLSVLVPLWQYCALVFFWQLLATATTHNQLFQEFHHYQHLASPPNLIHLHLFHCRNLTLLWTRGSIHPSSNYLQYRPHVHYRRHIIRLNTPECRCLTIPVVLLWSVFQWTLSKHVAQWDRTTCKDVANSERRNFVHSYTIPLQRFFVLQEYLRSVFFSVYPEWTPLPPKPLTIPWAICLRQCNGAFLPSWLMRSSLVYKSKL